MSTKLKAGLVAITITLWLAFVFISARFFSHDTTEEIEKIGEEILKAEISL